MTKRDDEFELREGDVIADDSGRLFRLVPIPDDEARTIQGFARLGALLGTVHEHECAKCGVRFRCELAAGCGDDERCVDCAT